MKTNSKMADLSATMSIITLNLNTLNISTKKQKFETGYKKEL